VWHVAQVAVRPPPRGRPSKIVVCVRRNARGPVQTRGRGLTPSSSCRVQSSPSGEVFTGVLSASSQSGTPVAWQPRPLFVAVPQLCAAGGVRVRRRRARERHRGPRPHVWCVRRHRPVHQAARPVRDVRRRRRQRPVAARADLPLVEVLPVRPRDRAPGLPCSPPPSASHQSSGTRRTPDRSSPGCPEPSAMSHAADVAAPETVVPRLWQFTVEQLPDAVASLANEAPFGSTSPSPRPSSCCRRCASREETRTPRGSPCRPRQRSRCSRARRGHWRAAAARCGSRAGVGGTCRTVSLLRSPAREPRRARPAPCVARAASPAAPRPSRRRRRSIVTLPGERQTLP